MKQKGSGSTIIYLERASYDTCMARVDTHSYNHAREYTYTKRPNQIKPNQTTTRPRVYTAVLPGMHAYDIHIPSTLYFVHIYQV